MQYEKQSFTLVEILVVIVIIGILSSFIFFTINDSVEKASIAKSKMFSESIRNNLLLNLVSEWKLDGNTNDSWGSNNGIPYNFPADPWKTESECVSGTCLNFDGENDYIDCGNMNSCFSNAITVGVWVKNTNSGSEKIIIGDGWYNDPAGRSWWLLKDNDNKFKFGIEVNNYEAASNSIINTTGSVWYYVVGVYDGTIIGIYVNGERGVDYLETASLSSNSSVRIGAGYYSDNVGYFFRGIIDDVQIYNSIISESEIRQNYLSGLKNLYAKGLISQVEYAEMSEK
jgi:prepilin-type N-terminal cleavage/methylation domain-containing protein